MTRKPARKQWKRRNEQLKNVRSVHVEVNWFAAFGDDRTSVYSIYARRAFSLRITFHLAWRSPTFRYTCEFLSRVPRAKSIPSYVARRGMEYRKGQRIARGTPSKRNFRRRMCNAHTFLGARSLARRDSHDIASSIIRPRRGGPNAVIDHESMIVNSRVLRRVLCVYTRIYLDVALRNGRNVSLTRFVTRNTRFLTYR